MKLEGNPGLTIGVLGLGSLQIVNMYMNAAPSLDTLRHRGQDDNRARQELLDADLLVGGLAAGILGLAYWTTGSVIPVLIIGGILTLTMGWYHLILASPTVPD
jgi:hypothetical protein